MLLIQKGESSEGKSGITAPQIWVGIQALVSQTSSSADDNAWGLNIKRVEIQGHGIILRRPKGYMAASTGSRKDGRKTWHGIRNSKHQVTTA